MRQSNFLIVFFVTRDWCYYVGEARTDCCTELHSVLHWRLFVWFMSHLIFIECVRGGVKVHIIDPETELLSVFINCICIVNCQYYPAECFSIFSIFYLQVAVYQFLTSLFLSWVVTPVPASHLNGHQRNWFELSLGSSNPTPTAGTIGLTRAFSTVSFRRTETLNRRQSENGFWGSLNFFSQKQMIWTMTRSIIHLRKVILSPLICPIPSLRLQWPWNMERFIWWKHCLVIFGEEMVWEHIVVGL